LWWHAGSKNWAKKLKGTVYYFGSDANKALTRYLRERDFLLAGQSPPPEEDGNVVTVRYCCNAFLEAKEGQKDAGELAPRSFSRYLNTAAFLVEHFGERRDATTLRPKDFEALRAKMAKRWGPVALGNEIQIIRTIFGYAYAAELLATPIRFGPMFRKPSAKRQREVRYAKGEQVFTPAQVKALLAVANPQMKAMLLLGLNGGLGCADVANLEIGQVDVEGGWYDVMRTKTATPRRFPYWPETAAALREVIATRPAPKSPADKDLVFIGDRGMNYKRRDRVSNAFIRIRKAAGIDPARTFYDARRTFETIAGNATNDERAVSLVMGHSVAQNDMPGRYLQRIDDARLLAVTNAVRNWLFGEAEAKQEK
jgi:integrase